MIVGKAFAFASQSAESMKLTVALSTAGHFAAYM
jgi:hypothetical protein